MKVNLTKGLGLLSRRRIKTKITIWGTNFFRKIPENESEEVKGLLEGKSAEYIQHIKFIVTQFEELSKAVRIEETQKINFLILLN